MVDPRAHQLRAPVEQRVLRPLRQGDAAGGADRVVPDAAGLPRPARSTPPAACGRSAASPWPARPCRSCSHTKDGPELLAALDASDEGRAFRRQLDEFLFDFGWRHDAVYDLADVPWREDPSIPLASIRAMMDARRQRGPRAPVPAERRRPARSCSPTCASALADDPDTLAKLDELYEAARYSFPLTEDHAFYIDQMCISVFRRFVLAVGERLVDKGVVDAARRRLLPLPRRARRRPRRTAATGGRRWPSGGPASSEPAPGHPADRARHAAPAARGPRPVHGRPRVPPARAWCRRRRTPTRTCSRRSPAHPASTPAPARVVRSLAQATRRPRGGRGHGRAR